MPERYHIPGIIEITYTGEDWGTEQSQQILENRFTSQVLQRAIETGQIRDVFKGKNHRELDGRRWYERPIGIVALAVIAGVIVAWIAFKMHWM